MVFMIDEEYSGLEIHLCLIADHLTVTTSTWFTDGSTQYYVCMGVVMKL